jgi:alkylhydroperoxidase family enzyme
MPRIFRLDKSQVTQRSAPSVTIFVKVRGNIPNMFRTVAHRPELLRTMIAHFRGVMETGTISTKLKELLFVRTSQINHCQY